MRLRCFLAILVIAFVPGLAAAQWAPRGAPPPTSAAQARLLTLTSTNGSPNVVVPLWQSADGHLLALIVDNKPQGPDALAHTGDSLDLHLVDASAFLSTSLRWNVSPHAYARAGVKQWAAAERAAAGCSAPSASRLGSAQSCLDAGVPAWLGGEIGAGFNVDGFNLDVGASWLDNALSHQLPRVVSGDLVAPGLLGIPANFIDSLEGVNARGSLRVGDSDTRVSVGASMSRMQLLPGRIVGMDAVDQKALSFGVGSGPVSGVVVGRVMQPVAGDSFENALPGKRWSAVDLGITWRLPWQGELRVGAQNLWSSDGAPQAAQHAPVDPAQQRMPYIQYHQEL